MSALGMLKGAFSGDDLVRALNLNIINFASGSALIPKDNEDVLLKSAEAIKAAKGVKIEVGGHTDNTGATAANLKLSADRANAVRAFLVKHGVPASALVAKGYGDAKPTATNDTDDGRFHNRRIEFTVTK
ncbi:MAG: OmpA family protein [Blastocatellia bacterium]